MKFSWFSQQSNGTKSKKPSNAQKNEQKNAGMCVIYHCAHTHKCVCGATSLPIAKIQLKLIINLFVILFSAVCLFICRFIRFVRGFHANNEYNNGLCYGWIVCAGKKIEANAQQQQHQQQQVTANNDVTNDNNGKMAQGTHVIQQMPNKPPPALVPTQQQMPAPMPVPMLVDQVCRQTFQIFLCRRICQC